MKHKADNRKLLWAAILFGAAAVLSLCLGTVSLTPGEVFSALFSPDGAGSAAGIVRYSRLPRTLACLLSGGALAAAGAVLQTVLGNQLASPSIIGVNAGAGLGVTVCCAFGMLSGWAVSAAAFGGSLIVAVIITLFSGRRALSRTTVILIGVAVNSILNAAAESVSALDPDVAALSVEFRVGGFSAVSWQRLIPAAILILAAAVLLLTLCGELEVVGLGDETACGLGLPVKRYRLLFLILSALLAGAAVSFAGLLGFVGLIVPHLLRRLGVRESRSLIPLCLLSGGAFVTLCDLGARLIFRPYELPVGILMAVIGGPVFVALLLKRKGGALYD